MYTSSRVEQHNRDFKTRKVLAEKHEQFTRRTAEEFISNRHNVTYERRTYHKSQRTRPRRDVASVVQVHAVIRAERVEHEARHLTCGALSAAQVLEAEHDLEDLRDRLLREGVSRAVVEARALQLVFVLGAARVDLERVGEVLGLQNTRTLEGYRNARSMDTHVEVRVPEAAEDDVARLDADVRLAVTHRDTILGDRHTKQTRKLWVQP